MSDKWLQNHCFAEALLEPGGPRVHFHICP